MHRPALSDLPTKRTWEHSVTNPTTADQTEGCLTVKKIWSYDTCYIETEMGIHYKYL